MSIGHWTRGWLLGVGLLGFFAVGAQAQDWGADKDVVITTPVTITPTGTVTTYPAQSVTVTNGGSLVVPEFNGDDAPVHILVGDGGVKLEDGGRIDSEAVWFNSMGGFTQTGGTMIVGGNHLTGVTGTPGSLDDIMNRVGGSYSITGGNFENGGGVITANFLASGNGELIINDIFARDRLTLGGSNMKFSAEPLSPSASFDDFYSTLVSKNIEMSGQIHFAFPDNDATAHLAIAFDSLRINDSAQAQYGASFNDVVMGKINVIGDLTLTSDGYTTDWDGSKFSGLVADTIELKAGTADKYTVLTMGDGAVSDIALMGSVKFNPYTKIKLVGSSPSSSDTASYAIASWHGGNAPVEDGWIMKDGGSLNDFLLSASIDAAPGATALIEIGDRAQLGLGYTYDERYRGTDNAYQSGTLRINAPTVILLDYNHITASSGHDETQLRFGRNPTIIGMDNLTLAINPDSVPNSVKAGDPAVAAVLASSDWQDEDSLSLAERNQKSRDDLLGLGFKSSYQYGLFLIDEVGVKEADIGDGSNAYLTGMVSKLTASGAMSPSLSSAGMNPQAQLLHVFDNYVPGTNAYMDTLYEGISTDAAGSYAGLAAGVNADAVVGGASVALQTQTASHANVSGRMTGTTTGGNVQSVAFASFSDMAYARLTDENLSLNKWTPGFGMWIAPLYTHARGKDIDVGGVNGGYRTDMGGGTLGLDYTTCDGAFRFGMAGNLGGGNSRATGGWTHGKNDFTFGGVELYAGAKWNNFTFMLNGGWSRNANELKSSTFSTAKYDTDVWSVGASAEYQLNLGGFNFIPGVAVEYANVKQDAFTLRFAGAPAFHNEKGSADVVNLPVSLRINKGFELAKGVLTPEINGAWIPSVKDKKINYNTSIIGMPGTVNANSPMMDRNTGQVGAGLKFDTDRYTVGAEYQYRFSNHYDSHNVGAVFRVKF